MSVHIIINMQPEARTNDNDSARRIVLTTELYKY